MVLATKSKKKIIKKPTTLKQSLERLKTHPRVRKATLEGNKLTIETSDLYLYSLESRSRRIKLGTAKITMDVDRDPRYSIDGKKSNTRLGMYYGHAPRIGFDPKSGTEYQYFTEGLYHKHVFTGGRMCMGNVHSTALEFYKEHKDLESILDFLLNFIETQTVDYYYYNLGQQPTQLKIDGTWVKEKDRKWISERTNPRRYRL